MAHFHTLNEQPFSCGGEKNVCGGLGRKQFIFADKQYVLELNILYFKALYGGNKVYYYDCRNAIKNKNSFL